MSYPCVMDHILNQYGLKFKVSPYRIINKHGVVWESKHFDLRHKVLQKFSNLTFKAPKIERTCLGIKKGSKNNDSYLKINKNVKK